MTYLPPGSRFATTHGRRYRHVWVAGVLAAAAGVVFGCSSGSSDDFSAHGPTSVGEPPAVQAGIPLPKDSVNRAVAKLDEIVNDAMKKSGIPGAAVAVVHGDKVIYAKGFGVRDVQTGDKVDANTVFQLASVSKSVSATRRRQSDHQRRRLVGYAARRSDARLHARRSVGV